MKNDKKIQLMCIAAVLCAVGVLIPMFSPIKIYLGPMTFTLASHVALFIAIFVSPTVGIAVSFGTTLGFLISGFAPVVVFRALVHIFFVVVGALALKKKPKYMQSFAGRLCFGLVLGVIHAVSEAIVVTFFYLGGMAITGSYAYSVLYLVGGGTLIHSMLDYYVALLVWRVLSKLPEVPANYKFEKKLGA